MYDSTGFTGTSTTVAAYLGVESTSCYNIVYPYGGMTSGFTLEGVSGIRFFEFQDCIGQVYEFPDTSSARYIGYIANDKANSFQFIP